MPSVKWPEDPRHASVTISTLPPAIIKLRAQPHHQQIHSASPEDSGPVKGGTSLSALLRSHRGGCRHCPSLAALPETVFPLSLQGAPCQPLQRDSGGSGQMGASLGQPFPWPGPAGSLSPANSSLFFPVSEQTHMSSRSLSFLAGGRCRNGCEARARSGLGCLGT